MGFIGSSRRGILDMGGDVQGDAVEETTASSRRPGRPPPAIARNGRGAILAPVRHYGKETVPRPGRPQGGRQDHSSRPPGITSTNIRAVNTCPYLTRHPARFKTHRMSRRRRALHLFRRRRCRTSKARAVFAAKVRRSAVAEKQIARSPGPQFFRPFPSPGVETV